jgi:hypothetical protein
MIDELPPGLQIFGPTVGGLVVAGLVLWRRISRERVESSKDDLEAKEATSQADWLRRLEERFEQERQRAEAAERRERVIFTELQEAKSQIREHLLALQLRGERIQRLQRRVNQQQKLLSEVRPEMRTWFVTEPAPLDELPKK